MVKDHLPNPFYISPHPCPSPPVGEGKRERGLNLSRGYYNSSPCQGEVRVGFVD